MGIDSIQQHRTVASIVNYFPPGGPRQIRPGTAGYQRRVFDSRKVQITDLRGEEDQLSLDKNGFQVVKNRWTNINIDDPDERIKSSVYPETANLLQKLTGATKVVPFSYQVRGHTVKQVEKMAEGLADTEVLAAVGPATFAHCDNSKRGAVPVLLENIPGDEFEKRQKSRWSIMNLWRPLSRPVTREPLALLDSRTVEEEDFVAIQAGFPKPGQGAFDNIYQAGGGFEVAQILANDKHQWFYVSNLTPEEALVFKQYDSKTDGRARQAPHCAFQCKDDFGPSRQSIEVRNLVFWEGESLE